MYVCARVRKTTLSLSFSLALFLPTTLSTSTYRSDVEFNEFFRAHPPPLPSPPYLPRYPRVSFFTGFARVYMWVRARARRWRNPPRYIRRRSSSNDDEVAAVEREGGGVGYYEPKPAICCRALVYVCMCVCVCVYVDRFCLAGCGFRTSTEMQWTVPRCRQHQAIGRRRGEMCRRDNEIIRRIDKAV